VFSAEGAAVGEERGSADLREPHRRAEHRDHRRVPHVRYGAVAAGKFSTIIDPQSIVRQSRVPRLGFHAREIVTRGFCRGFFGLESPWKDPWTVRLFFPFFFLRKVVSVFCYFTSG